MKILSVIAGAASVVLASCAAGPQTVSGYDDIITYIGRLDRTDSVGPRQWGAGTYFTFAFNGDGAEMVIADQRLYGDGYNYLEVVLDGDTVGRIATGGPLNRLIVGNPQTAAVPDTSVYVMQVADSLKGGRHTLLVCRDTECGMGYTQVMSVTARGIEKWQPATAHRIEFIGNSITSGMEIYDGVLPFGEGRWYDHHRAYFAYGPRTARNLNAQWSLASVSGIGLIHSCCDHKYVLPQTYGKVDLVDNQIDYDFSFNPDLVVSALGQNDGVQDSSKFATAYVDFIRLLREKNPEADIALISSPMANDTLRTFFKSVLPAIASEAEAQGLAGKSGKIPYHIFEQSYNAGGAEHPNMAEHEVIAAEVTGFIKEELGF